MNIHICYLSCDDVSNEECACVSERSRRKLCERKRLRRKKVRTIGVAL